MTLRDRIPVEPLEEERLARIERAVIAGLPARRARTSPWRVAAPVAALAIAAAVALVVWRGGRDEAAPPAADPVVVTAAADGARVDLGDAEITTGAGASFTATRPDGGVAIRLAGGRIELDVAPRKDRPPLVVYADDVTVTVVGTRFIVEWDDEVTVTVIEGLVRVERGGARRMLAAGQTWSEPARVAVAIAAAPPEPAPAPVIEEPVIEEPAPPRKPRARDPEPPKPVVIDPVETLSARIKKQPYARPVAVEGDDALAAYRAMSRQSGDEGARGLYGVAWTQVREGKRDARRSLDLYVQRFPKGAELDDVLWLRLRVLCLEKIDGECRRAAHTFLNDFPGDDRAAVAVSVTLTDRSDR